MNLILLGLVSLLLIYELISGNSVDISYILSKFKKDKTLEIKNKINETRIEDISSKEHKIKEEINANLKKEDDKTKDEVLKFWNKK